MRARVGLLDEQGLRQFVTSLNELSHMLSALGGQILRASYAPETTEHEYDAGNWNTPVGYHGPYTVMLFDGVTYEVKRCESETIYYSATQGHEPGISIELTVPAGFRRLSLILSLMPSSIPMESVNISAKEGYLLISFHCPLDEFLYKQS